MSFLCLHILVNFLQSRNFYTLSFANNFRPLDKGLTIDKIKEIRAKLISNRRTRIKPEDEDAGGKGENLASAIGELEVNIIFSSGRKVKVPFRIM